jgi:hypothetical protein
MRFEELTLEVKIIVSFSFIILGSVICWGLWLYFKMKGG